MKGETLCESVFGTGRVRELTLHGYPERRLLGVRCRKWADGRVSEFAVLYMAVKRGFSIALSSSSEHSRSAGVSKHISRDDGFY